MSTLLLSMMEAFAEFERALSRERQMEEIAVTKRKAVYKGRMDCLNKEQVEVLKNPHRYRRKEELYYLRFEN